LNYRGAAETVASGINDNGTIVGYSSKNLPPNERKHGFIYGNGKWASLSYPNSKPRCKAPDTDLSCRVSARISQGLGAAHALGAEHVI
jgi:probable HAF family extracellular repeat protein